MWSTIGTANHIAQVSPHLKLNSPQWLCLSKAKCKIYQNRMQHNLNTCWIQSFLMIQNNLVDYGENRTEVCFISFISAVAVIWIYRVVLFHTGNISKLSICRVLHNRAHCAFSVILK